ncbi:Trm112 family protein [Candidatus Latescibacterota bacterium]
MIDQELLDILVCPVSKGKLEYDEKEDVLICSESRLKYPIIDGIPVMLPERAERF